MDGRHPRAVRRAGTEPGVQADSSVAPSFGARPGRTYPRPRNDIACASRSRDRSVFGSRLTMTSSNPSSSYASRALASSSTVPLRHSSSASSHLSRLRIDDEDPDRLSQRKPGHAVRRRARPEISARRCRRSIVQMPVPGRVPRVRIPCGESQHARPFCRDEDRDGALRHRQQSGFRGRRGNGLPRSQPRRATAVRGS